MKALTFILMLATFVSFKSVAQKTADRDSVMITIFLKHQQNKNLDSLQVIEKKNKFDKLFSSGRISGAVVVCDDGHWPGSNR